MKKEMDARDIYEAGPPCISRAVDGFVRIGMVRLFRLLNGQSLTDFEPFLMLFDAGLVIAGTEPTGIARMSQIL